MADWVPAELVRILAETSDIQQAYLVGGCVRDWLLGIPGKDFDIEIFGVTYERLVAALGRWGKTDLVGRSFGVVKLTTPGRTTYDFTIPRRDSKVAPGHKGFAISFDPGITPEEAAARRDFGRLRALRDRLAKNCPPNISLADLSMGMSGDFEVAIEEGATIVRVGSALFEGIEL